MIVDSFVIVSLVAIALAFFILGIVFYKNPKMSEKLNKENLTKIMKSEVHAKDILEKLNKLSFVQSAGNVIHNQTELDKLFRKAKNPWNLTPQTFNFIRFGGLGFGIILALVTIQFSWPLSILFAIFAIAAFVVPEQQYKSIAKDRENQWNQLYQFMWVIEHNLSYYDAKKTWFEVENYIVRHTENLPELVQGFHDFGTHWTGNGMDDYLKKYYGEFSIPSQLFNIVQNAQDTGEYPKNELGSLRTLIIQRMDFAIKDTLSMVATQATLISTPCVLITVCLIVLVPTAINILASFG